MGVYVYTRRAKVQKMEINGEVVDVGYAKYAYKPGWNWDQLNRSFIARMMGIAESAAHRHPTDYYVIVDSDGDIHGVYKYPGFVSGYDEPNFPGEFMGYAHKIKVGRRINYIVRKDQRHG